MALEQRTAQSCVPGQVPGLTKPVARSGSRKHNPVSWASPLPLDISLEIMRGKQDSL